MKFITLIISLFLFSSLSAQDLSFSRVIDTVIVVQTGIQQITDNINFLEAKDLSEYWQDCIAFNKTLDAERNQGPFDVINPEFANYV